MIELKMTFNTVQECKDQLREWLFGILAEPAAAVPEKKKKDTNQYTEAKQRYMQSVPHDIEARINELIRRNQCFSLKDISPTELPTILAQRVRNFLKNHPEIVVQREVVPSHPTGFKQMVFYPKTTTTDGITKLGLNQPKNEPFAHKPHIINRTTTLPNFTERLEREEELQGV